MDAEVSAQLLLFVEQTADLVGVADGWGRVLYVNPAAAKRLGVVDPNGLTLADLFPTEENDLLSRRHPPGAVARRRVEGRGARRDRR